MPVFGNCQISLLKSDMTHHNSSQHGNIVTYSIEWAIKSNINNFKISKSFEITRLKIYIHYIILQNNYIEQTFLLKNHLNLQDIYKIREINLI